MDRSLPDRDRDIEPGARAVGVVALAKGATMTLGGIILIILGGFIASQNTRSVMPMPLIIVGIVLLILAAVLPARAHDAPTDWIGQERRTNAAGVLCCGKGDCFPFTADQIKVMPDGYHFPDGHVASFQSAAPSVDGFWWKCEWGNEVKCIFAPMGGS